LGKHSEDSLKKREQGTSCTGNIVHNKESTRILKPPEWWGSPGENPVLTEDDDNNDITTTTIIITM
jgi:hypothetical protein